MSKENSTSEDTLSRVPEGDGGETQAAGPSAQGEGSAREKRAAEPQPAASAEAKPEEGAQRPPEALEEQVRALESRLAAAERRSEEHWNQTLRARAELDNLQKRSAREIENAHKYALEKFVAELLPVKDSLELGLSAAQDQDVDVARVREGVDLTLKMFRTVMERFGIEEVTPARGEAFDPQYHEAMSTQEAEGVEPGQVVMVVQRGYLLNGRLVRPAMVIVGK